MRLIFPMCSILFGKFNQPWKFTLFQKKRKLAQLLSMTIISVGKLQLTYLCGVSDFAEAYAALPNWKANSPLVQNDGENLHGQVLVWTLEVEGQDAVARRN